jgi:thymidine kinase
MVTEGAQVVVGDVDMAGDPSSGGAGEHEPVVGYETLCRRHFMRRVTAHGANVMAQQDQLLPFEVDACLWNGTGETRRG